MPERFRGEFLTMGRYTNLSTVTFYLLLITMMVSVSDSELLLYSVTVCMKVRQDLILC